MNEANEGGSNILLSSNVLGLSNRKEGSKEGNKEGRKEVHHRPPW